MLLVKSIHSCFRIALKISLFSFDPYGICREDSFYFQYYTLHVAADAVGGEVGQPAHGKLVF